MRKGTTVGMIALMVLLSGCKQEAEPVLNESEKIEFYAVLSDEPQSKTVRQADGKVFWSPNEDIQIFQGSRKGKFTSSNTDECSTATFSGKMNSSIDDGSDYWAVYPYDEGSLFGDWYITVPIQPNQQATAGTFADGMFPLIAKSSSNTLSFLNVCGGIKFRVYNTGIKQVIFKGNKDEIVAGSATVAMEDGKPVIKEILASSNIQPSTRIRVTAPAGGFVVGEDYYIVIPPIQFQEGFSLTFVNSNNLEAVFTTNKSITVTRSKFGVLRDLDKDLVFAEGHEVKIANERDILVSIYNALNGSNWNNQANWLSDSPVGTWDGVTTNDDGQVVTLSLYDSNLEGAFPNEICQLDQLQDLFIIGQVAGSLPSTINSLSRLRTLIINSSVFSGALPNGICDLSELENLSIVGAGITGKLPDEIGNLSNLRIVELTGFDGPLPESFENLTRLEEIKFYGAQLNQPFPEYILGFSQLSNITFDSCGLIGTIPNAIGDLNKLETINLSYNNLSGSIPESIGSLDKLCELSLNGNSFTSFPGTFSRCDNLKWVYISENKSEMVFNNDIWKAPALTYLYAENSHLCGAISEDIGCAMNLIVLDLANNQLSGELPTSISGLASIQSISLAKNQFSGALPSSMSNLSTLLSLDIHNNSFTGSIPDSYKSLTGLESFSAYNNYMSGSISEDIVLMDVFSNWQLTPQYGDGVFSYSLYESTDYSNHKAVSLLHPATKGPGINVVLMGDAFTDKDITNGDYDHAMNLSCEALFQKEPFTSYEDYFNVYAITLVSKNGHYAGETALNIDFDPFMGSDGYSGYYGSSLDVVDELFPGLDKEQLTVAIIVNRITRDAACSNYLSGSGETTPYGSGVSVSVIPSLYLNPDGGEGLFKNVFVHEVCGHGFGKLGDEYVTCEEEIDHGNMTYIQNVEHGTFGRLMNISVTNDASSVPWSSFLNLPEYTSEGIGIYEGGYSYQTGVWRPTPTSIMSCDYNTYPYFNAPSREAIYRRINLIINGPGWNYDFNEFLAWDAKNLGNN